MKIRATAVEDVILESEGMTVIVELTYLTS